METEGDIRRFQKWDIVERITDAGNDISVQQLLCMQGTGSFGYTGMDNIDPLGILIPCHFFAIHGIDTGCDQRSCTIGWRPYGYARDMAASQCINGWQNYLLRIFRPALIQRKDMAVRMNIENALFTECFVQHGNLLCGQNAFKHRDKRILFFLGNNRTA